MYELLELVSIVSLKRLSVIDSNQKILLDSDSNYSKLYKAIDLNKVKNDDEAANLIYNTSRNDPKYLMLKSRLKDKILKSILLLDSKDLFNNENGRAYYDCIAQWQRIEALIHISGTTKLVAQLIKENYADALKYQFYEILKNYSFHLTTYYALNGDEKSLKEESEKYLDYVRLAQKIQFAKYLYNSMIVSFVNSVPITDVFLAQTKRSLEELYQIRQEVKNPDVDFFYFYIALLYYESNNELDKILALCDEAEALMQSKPHFSTNIRKASVLFYRLKAYFNSKEFDKGFEALSAKKYITFTPSNYNWFLLKEMEFKLYLQADKTEEAAKICQEVAKNKSLKQLAAQNTEKWKIFHAYQVFMDSYLHEGNYKFSLTKFSNEVPVISKDKSGYNFTIRILEILFLFARKEYNFVFQKMEALRVYRTRYLNDNAYKRSHFLLTLLLKAEKQGFKGKAMQSIDGPELEALRTRNHYIIADWEVIPYEVVWDMLVRLAK